MQRIGDELGQSRIAHQLGNAYLDVSAMLDFALDSAIGRARSGVAVERDYDASFGSVQCRAAPRHRGRSDASPHRRERGGR